MSVITTDSESWIGSILIGNDDRKLGTIEAIYFDEETGRAQWMAVKNGVFHNKHSFVPLAGATPTDYAVMTPYDKSQVDDAPKIAPNEDLPDEQVAELYAYYGLDYDAPIDSDPASAQPDVNLMATDPGTQSEHDMLMATARNNSHRAA